LETVAGSEKERVSELVVTSNVDRVGSWIVAVRFAEDEGPGSGDTIREQPTKTKAAKSMLMRNFNLLTTHVQKKAQQYLLIFYG
jgi:hypothetical protein